MIPLCYGVVDGNAGLPASNSGNFTMAKIGTGQYEVTIPEENYVSANYVTVATAAFNTPAIVTTFPSNGKLQIYIFDLAGNPKSNFFHFCGVQAVIMPYFNCLLKSFCCEDHF
jgi:hypothetical protein